MDPTFWKRNLSGMRRLHMPSELTAASTSALRRVPRCGRSEYAGEMDTWRLLPIRFIQSRLPLTGDGVFYIGKSCDQRIVKCRRGT